MLEPLFCLAGYLISYHDSDLKYFLVRLHFWPIPYLEEDDYIMYLSADSAYVSHCYISNCLKNFADLSYLLFSSSNCSSAPGGLSVIASWGSPIISSPLAISTLSLSAFL